MRILYVDDDALAVRAVARELADAERQIVVRGVTSPFEAVALLETEAWDVVLSDFSMPGMDGVDLLQKVFVLRPNARRVLLTATPDEPKVIAAARAGLVAAVLGKPVAVAELKDAVGITRSKHATPRDGTSYS